MATQAKKRPLFEGPIVRRAHWSTLSASSTPQIQIRNPVMFIVYVGQHPDLGPVHSGAPRPRRGSGAGSSSAISIWLWLTVLFANFAEAIAEGRGKAQAEALRRARRDVQAKRLARPERDARSQARSRPARCAGTTSSWSRPGTLIPGDGEVIDGVRLGRRERDHRRERARDPRERRRPECGDGRHTCPLRLAHRAHQRQSRRGLPRPHDRHGRGRQAPEDAERDRAQHPPRRASPSSSCWRRRPCCLSRSSASRRPARERR